MDGNLDTVNTVTTPDTLGTTLITIIFNGIPCPINSRRDVRDTLFISKSDNPEHQNPLSDSYFKFSYICNGVHKVNTYMSIKQYHDIIDEITKEAEMRKDKYTITMSHSWI